MYLSPINLGFKKNNIEIQRFKDNSNLGRKKCLSTTLFFFIYKDMSK